MEKCECSLTLQKQNVSLPNKKESSKNKIAKNEINHFYKNIYNQPK